MGIDDRAASSPLGGFGVSSRIADDWLELSLGGSSACEQAWSLLERNAALNGPVRLTVPYGADTADVRAEIWIEDEPDLETRAADLGDRMRLTFHAIDQAPSVAEHAGPAAETTALLDLCAEAGWPGVARDSGEVNVDLDPGASVPARIVRANGHLRVVVDVVDVTGCPAESRQAIALLLLAAGHVVRMVKAVARTSDGIECAGLAVDCDRVGSAAGLDRALSALAVACRMTVREAQALRHDALAIEYLSWRTPDRSSQPRAVTVNHHTVEEHTCLQQP